jgi:hypothetical protein
MPVDYWISTTIGIVLLVWSYRQTPARLGEA